MSNTVIAEEKIIAQILTDDGTFPNNENIPTLIYKDPLGKGRKITARDFEAIFDNNSWPSAWRYGIYTFQHYHSTAHEVLGVYKGATQVQLGGTTGFTQRVEPGDVIVIPAGVAHQNVGSNTGFKCVGGYANGDQWDMNYGKPEERPRADENIADVSHPIADPIFGDSGPLVDHWNLSAKD